MSRLHPRRFLARTGASLLGAVALCVVLTFTHRARASSALDAANRAFAEGHYTDAATQYESLLSRRGYSAPVLFDLGNANLRAHRAVDAILAYERATLLSPRDSAIATNLAAARKAAGVPDDGGLTDRFEHLLSMNEWTWLATGAIWLTVASASGATLFRRRRSALTTAACLGTLVAAVAGAGLALSRHVLHEGLVMSATPALVSPFASAQSSFSLGPGAPVELGPARDGYVLVHGRDGRSGWVELGAVARIIPD
jgi:hypothetical protein